MKKLKELITAITITYAMIFSIRIVTIPTALTIPEQITIIAMLVEYTVKISRTKDD